MTSQKYCASALVLCGLAGLVGASTAQAGTGSWQGQFTQDDQLLSIGLILTATDTLTVTTFSYGGLAAPSSGIAAGGFAPVLALFDGASKLLQLAAGSANSCGGAGSGARDPTSGFCWDAHFSAPDLLAGRYTVVLSQDGNTPLGPTLADGYLMAGMPDYTSIYNGVPGSRFIEVTGRARTGFYALGISTLTSPVPEPTTALMLALGLAGLGLLRRRGSR
jgi:hypothetical protein